MADAVFVCRYLAAQLNDDGRGSRFVSRLGIERLDVLDLRE